MGKIIRDNRSAHYYEENGTPAYGATASQARKGNLYPSATTIIGILDKYEIGVWKQETGISAALDIVCERFSNIYSGYEPTDVLPMVYDMIQKIARREEGFIKSVRERIENKMSEAATLGTHIHDIIECYLEGRPLGTRPPEAWDVWKANAIDSWLENNISNPVCEMSFTNTELGFGGRIDCQAEVKEIRAVIDFKTQRVKRKTAAFYPEYGYQLAAYRKFDSTEKEFIPNEKGRRCMSVIFSTNPELPGVHVHLWPENISEEPAAMKYISLERGWKIFKNTLELFNLTKKLEKL